MNMNDYLCPTETLDWDSPEVKEKSERLTAGLHNPEEKAAALFHFVRDQIRYGIFETFPVLEDFRASTTLARGYGFCIPKAVLLASLGKFKAYP